MDFAFTTDQRFIRDRAREYFADRGRSELLRAALATPEGWHAELWTGLAQEQGWLGVATPARFGGSGLGLVELAMVMEEAGRVLAAVPLFETIGLAAQLIGQTASEDQQAALLPRLISGEVKAAVCLTGQSGLAPPDGVAAELTRDGAGFALTGEASYVSFGHIADLLVVVARTPGRRGWDGLSLVAIPAAKARIERLDSLDITRPYSRVSFDNVAVDPAMILGAAGAVGGVLRRALQVCAGLLGAEQLGGASRSLEGAVDYAKQRVQFGRPIGSFQAVKHRLADMATAVESARSAAYAAVCIAEDFPDLLEEAAAVARVCCSQAFLDCAGGAIQVHGGIGFTWEHDAHLYFKRARSSANLLGDAAGHRETIARLIGLDRAAA